MALKIYGRPGDEGKGAYAMDSLKRAMRWDEATHGREYDLDLFMIVAVDDFNMGAMENKGLNIFNSKYILASPETATDRDYELIEAIVAHEYFHNWTGNRITCRDWFQLCLKEGLTVFRDQQFSGDTRSHAVQRIDDVKVLRARQFRAAPGPLARAVRPDVATAITTSPLPRTAHNVTCRQHQFHVLESCQQDRSSPERQLFCFAPKPRSVSAGFWRLRGAGFRLFPHR